MANSRASKNLAFALSTNKNTNRPDMGTLKVKSKVASIKDKKAFLDNSPKAYGKRMKGAFKATTEYGRGVGY